MYFGDDLHNRPLSPDDLDLLQSILNEEIEVRRITIKSDQADELAGRLIRLFQSGVRQPELLRLMIRGG
nr:hypothetical protein [Ensifer aridi]